LGVVKDRNGGPESDMAAMSAPILL